MTADEIRARAGRYRDLSIKHHTDALSRVSADTLLERARQIGLTSGHILFDDRQEMPLVYDLSLYTAPAGRSRAVDRHAKPLLAKVDGEEAQVLRAMLNARFSVWRVEREHETAGLVLTDLMRGGEVWLVDEAFAGFAKPAMMVAGRLLPVDAFFITCGVMVPTAGNVVNTAFSDRLGWAREGNLVRLADDPRCPVAIYRATLEQAAAAGLR